MQVGLSETKPNDLVYPNLLVLAYTKRLRNLHDHGAEYCALRIAESIGKLVQFRRGNLTLWYVWTTRFQGFRPIKVRINPSMNDFIPPFE